MKRNDIAGFIALLLLTSSLTMAGVVLHLSSPADGLVRIGYTATEGYGVFGVALKVELSDGATAVHTDIVSIHPAFNVFIDYVFSYQIGEDYELGQGHPFAHSDSAGVIDVPASCFSISMGAMNEAGIHGAPDIIEDLITFRIQDDGAGFSTVTLSSDTLRGGILGEAIGVVTFPEPLYVVIPEPATLLVWGLGGLALRRKQGR